MVEWIQLKSQDGNVFENVIKCHESWKKRGLWFFKQLSFAALGINTKSKIRKQLQSPASWALANLPASNPVLSTSNMRGVSEGLPAISFLRFSQKRHLIFFFSSGESSLFPSCSLYLTRLTRRTVPFALGSTAQRRTAEPGDSLSSQRTDKPPPPRWSLRLSGVMPFSAVTS